MLVWPNKEVDMQILDRPVSSSMGVPGRQICVYRPVDCSAGWEAYVNNFASFLL